MADENGQLTYWKNLHTQAENGAISIDKDIGDALVQECGKLIDRLRIAVNDAYNLQYVSGFGGLSSAQKLAEKFAGKAMSDPDSAVNRLNEALEIAKTMQDTYRLMVQNLTQQDQETGQQIVKSGHDQ